MLRLPDPCLVVLSEAATMEFGGERYAPVVGTAQEQIGRYRELAEVIAGFA